MPQSSGSRQRNPLWMIPVLVVGSVVGLIVIPPEHHKEFLLVVVVVGAALIVRIVSGLNRSIAHAADAARPGDGEPTLKEGRANHRVGWIDSRGGVLVLTPTRLTFSTHGIAQRAKVQSWMLDDVESVEQARILGVPNGLRLRVNGSDVNLVVEDRDSWADAINAARKARQTATGAVPAGTEMSGTRGGRNPASGAQE